MASALSTIETKARRHLLETTASFWSSAELIDIVNLGIKDLWRAIVDLHQEHFLIVDTTSLSIPTSAGSMNGVPANCYRVHLIEPTDTTTTGTYKGVAFVPRDYNSPNSIAARTQTGQDPTQAQVIYYALTQQGPPVSAPKILVDPQLTTAMAAGSIRLVYVPTLEDVVAAQNNPIPGESDQALIAWTVAFARAKEREDRSPDPNWLAVYATEKQSLLTSLTPRQTQEPAFVEAIFESLW